MEINSPADPSFNNDTGEMTQYVSVTTLLLVTAVATSLCVNGVSTVEFISHTLRFLVLHLGQYLKARQKRHFVAYTQSFKSCPTFKPLKGQVETLGRLIVWSTSQPRTAKKNRHTENMRRFSEYGRAVKREPGEYFETLSRCFNNNKDAGNAVRGGDVSPIYL